MVTRATKLRPITEAAVSEPLASEEKTSAWPPIILGLYAAVLFAATHINLSGTALDHRNTPAEFVLIEVLFHFGSYTLLTFLLILSLTQATDVCEDARLASARRLLVSCAILMIFAIVDECTQPFFGRNLELADLLANIFGIAAGQLSFVVFEASGWRSKLMRLK